jgi:hypothetical protein
MKVGGTASINAMTQIMMVIVGFGRTMDGLAPNGQHFFLV